MKAFANEDHEGARYGGAIAAVMRLSVRRLWASSLFGGLQVMATYTAAALVLFYGGHLLIRGEITGGALASFVVYTNMASGALTGLSDSYVRLLRAMGAAEGRLLRQLLTESVLLGVLGGALGLLLAYGAVHTLVVLGPDVLPRLEDIRVDGGYLCQTI